MRRGTPWLCSVVQMDGPAEVVVRIKEIWGSSVTIYSTGTSPLRLIVEKRPLIGSNIPAGKFKFFAIPVGQQVVGWETGGEHCFIKPDPARRDQSFRFMDRATGLELVVLLSPQP